MANEYLTRTPTSTGNRKVWTFSYWIKRNKISTDQNVFYTTQGSTPYLNVGSFASTDRIVVTRNESATVTVQYTKNKFRDVGSWTHILVLWDTTHSISSSRVRLFVNGAEQKDFEDGAGGGSPTYPTINYEGGVNRTVAHLLGAVNTGGGSGITEYLNSELTDIFFIDGQALTPDVFGFNKVGKGYISAGSTQSTDFRPGQWVPKTPRVIKTAINNNGGFGVNGFYLPMNDSNNFGADFHCDPNSIITLNEKLPQPRVGVATTASVGLGYTDALRADPYAANLVLALPFVSGGLQSGFGDYSAAIKGSGSPKTITNSNVSIGNTASYYGSAGNFTSASSSYLTSPRNVSDYNMGSGDFTAEGWFYFKSINTGQYTRFFSIGNSNLEGILFELLIGTSQITFYSRDTINNSNVINGPVIVAGQWYHIALCRKSSIVSAYINGVCIGTVDIASRILNFDSNTAVVIGAWENSIGSYTRFTDAYMQDLRIYKGVAKYTGGFDVPKPYTPVGIATWRAVPDTTANNFATWNPAYPVITGSNAVYTNGNLTIAEPTGNNSQGTATIGVSTGKWYYEAFPSNVTTGSHLIGIRPAEWFTDNSQNRTAYRSEGSVYNDSATTVQSGTTYTSSDIIGVAFNMNTKQLWFSKNGSWVYSGNPSGGSNQAVSFASTYTHYTPMFCFDNVVGTQTWDTNFGQNPTFSGNTTAGTFTDSNGKGLFKYQPPSGFLALCEDNLPTPAIANPGRHFKTVLWTGDGASGRSITGIGFTPDLVWIKERTSTSSNWITDSVRGSNIIISTNSTNGEVSGGGQCITSFNQDGFGVGNDGAFNENAQTYVAWCWKAGAGTTSTNTNGSITSVVSVNQDAGFSIVSWTGNGSSTATVGHGLGKVPAFLISKARGGTNDWWVVHKSGNGNLQLNNTSALITSGGTNGSMGYPSTLTNSTFTFTNGASSVNNANNSGTTYISYCWTEIEGFSKAFSYVGNGSADGPFVYTGHRPAFVMIKRTDSTANWFIFDNSRNSTNPNLAYLVPNAADIESSSGGDMDFLSNGFKIRNTSASLNASGGTYIGMAFAESPFQTANSK